MITRKRIMYFLLFFFLVICFAPYVVNLERFRSRIEQTLHDNLGIDANIHRLSWRWFPVPGILLKEISLKQPSVSVSIAKAYVHPELSELIRGTVSIRSIRLVEPDIRLTSREHLSVLLHGKEKTGTPSDKTFPFGNIMVSIEKGRISGLFTESGIAPATPDFSDITLTILTSPTHLTVEGRLASSFMDAGRLTLDLFQKEPDVLKWDLRIKIQHLDYGPVRTLLLKKFPDNPVVLNVCRDMIQGGTIKSGSFQFAGTTDQWHDVSRMNATAQVDKVVFHIPKSSLLLKQTAGTLTLDHGTLSGKDMATIVGSTRGTKGSFSLGLGQATAMPFSLAIDLAADVSDLPKVFHSFLPDGALKQDLVSIKDLSGNAAGALTLSGNISDLKVGVSVREMTVSGFYPRINHRVSIAGGALDLKSEGLTWTHISGDIGPHHVHEASGKLDWEKDLMLTITSMNADIQAQDIYPRLLADKTLGARLQPLVSSVRGYLDLNEFKFEGPLNNPEDWLSQGRISTIGITLETPTLPNPLTLISPDMRFTQASVTTRNLTARMDDQVIRLSGTWKPENIHADLYGTVAPGIGPWIKSKGWFPNDLLPVLPCRLDPLSVSWTRDALSVKGRIIHNNGPELPITTQLDLSIQPEIIQINRLSINDGKKQAELSATLPQSIQAGHRDITFDGAFDGTSLARILVSDRTLQGTLQGKASLAWPLDDSNKAQLNGNLEVTGLKVHDEANKGASLSSLKVDGQGGQARFDLEGLTLSQPNKPQLNVNTLEGDILFLPGLEADVDLSSGEICGIDLSGALHLPSMAMDIQTRIPPETPRSFETLTQCLGLDQPRITGQVTWSGSFKGTTDMITEGKASLHAQNGVIYKDTILSKIFVLLDMTELFNANSINDLLGDGYRYDSMDIDATITGHNMHISRAQIIGAGINFYATGYADLKNKSLDLYVLASPFKTVDRLVSHIPLIGKKLGGKNKSLISVPLKVEGHFNRPRIRILPKSVTQVSSDILDAFVYTFKLPFKLSSELVTISDKVDSKKALEDEKKK